MSFASFPLDTLGLKPAQLAAAKRAGLATAADVLLTAPADLARRLRTGHGPGPAAGQAAHDLVRAVSTSLVPKAHTLAELPPTPTVRTGDAALDAALGGGIRVGAITELVGESAAGKSHLTLALALAAQLPSLSTAPGGAVVLTSERVLATGRLVELARALLARTGETVRLNDLLDNVHTSRVADIDALEHALTFVVPPMLEARRGGAFSPLLGQLREEEATGDGPGGEGDPASREVRHPPEPGQAGARPPARGHKPIRILILDSLTALLRGETERSTAGLAQRSKHLCNVADKLKALALEHNMAVVVVNQVSDVFADSTAPLGSQLSDGGVRPLPPMTYAIQARHFSGQSPGVAKEASLGIVWANAVNTRIMLARTGRRRLLTLDDVVRGKQKRQRTASNGNTASATVNQGSPAEEDAPPPLGLELDAAKATLIRRLHVVFSPVAPPAMLDYIITPSGVHALPGTYRVLDLGPAIRKRDARLRDARRAAAEAGGGADAGIDAPNGTQIPTATQDDDDVFDDLGDMPPEFWEGVEYTPAEPLAVGVVE